MNRLPHLASLLLLFATPAAQAIVIDFESASGYLPGDLHNQPAISGGPQWKTPAYNIGTGAISVTTGVGTGGSQALRSAAASTISASNYVLTMSDEALGDLFDPTSSLIRFSFQLKWESTGTFVNQGRFFVGGNSETAFNGDVLRVYWTTDGGIGYVIGMPGGTTQARAAKTATNSDFRATAGTFYTISGTIDYASKTYRLSMNNVDQSDANGNFDLAFVAPGSTQINPNIQLMSLNNNHANYQPWVLDDLEFQATIPEPGAVALATGTLLLGAGWRRLRATQAKQ